jgi:hypothetical protein
VIARSPEMLYLFVFTQSGRKIADALLLDLLKRMLAHLPKENCLLRLQIDRGTEANGRRNCGSFAGECERSFQTERADRIAPGATFLNLTMMEEVYP